MVERLDSLCRMCGLTLSIKLPYLGLQQINLLLLSKQAVIQRVNCILGKIELDFKFGEL